MKSNWMFAIKNLNITGENIISIYGYGEMP